MIIVPTSFDFVDPNLSDPEEGIKLLKKIELIGRISHRSEDKQTEDSWQRFIPSVVMNHGDMSIIEHASVTIVAEVDRGITHELVRHRLAAYTQESTRFVNYNKQEMRFIKPPFVADEEAVMTWRDAVVEAERSYLYMLKRGHPPQLARSVLPNALASKIAITMNLRMWRHFLLMRTSKESHPQMKELTIPLLEAFKQGIPILFDDIEPEQKQSEAMKKLR